MIKANSTEANELKRILDLYEECSGQCINKEKSAIMFSANTRVEQKEDVKRGVGISCETSNERYLGLPVYVGRSHKQVFTYLKDAVWRRMQGWKERLLDKVGKEVLVKAVAQAIPTYAMSCLYLTKTLCDEISSLIAKLWWSQQDKESKIHWIGW